MPLPCSPVSHSAPSETQSSVPHSEDSDDSLTTPRAGPADPAQRTHANLSRPSLPPPVSGSPESVRELPQAGKASRRSSGSSGRRVEGLGLGTASPARSTSPPATRSSTTEKRDTPFETQTEGHPSEPYASGSSPRKPAPAFGTEKPQPSERGSTVSFTALTSHPRAKRQGSYNNPAMSRLTPSESPHAATRRPYDDLESSADEGTAIFKRVSPRDYGATGGDVRQPNGADDVAAAGYEGAAEEDGPRRRKTVGVKVRSGNGTSANADQADGARGRDAGEEHEAWWKRMVEKYGSVELENKGSVARDHLALERTFLAWLRTSLAFASIGVAVTQLFRLNTSLQNAEKEVDTSSLSMFELLLSNAEPQQKLRHVGKPLGATFLGISILILLLGFHRYFESQHYVIRGKFPASRGSIFLVSLLTFALIVASLVVVLTVAPGAFERR